MRFSLDENHNLTLAFVECQTEEETPKYHEQIRYFSLPTLIAINYGLAL